MPAELLHRGRLDFDDGAVVEMGKRFTTAWKSGRSSAHVFAFESPAALFRVLTPKR